MLRHFSGALIGMVAAVALAGVAGARTKVVHWSPFLADTSLRAGLAPVARWAGNCWTGSFVVPHGYRCNSSHYLYDPCFADPSRDDVVLCARDPWNRGVVRLRVTGQMNARYSARPGTIWAVRLRGGQRCVLQGGGTHQWDDAGRTLLYWCRKSSTVLWGYPRRDRPTWRIYASHDGSGVGPLPSAAEHLVQIGTAYIGVSEP